MDKNNKTHSAMSSLTQTRKKLVVQSNEITEAAYYLSLKAKRALWMCLSDIKREAGGLSLKLQAKTYRSENSSDIEGDK